MNPLVPLGIPRRIRLLVLGLEHAHDLPLGVPRKVAPGAALRDHAWMHSPRDGRSHALDQRPELVPPHEAAVLLLLPRLPREPLRRGGPHALGGLQHRVVAHETPLVAVAVTPPV